MPSVDDRIDRVARALFISTLDLSKGYCQVPIAEEDSEKTTITTSFGPFQFYCMPFGLHGALQLSNGW